MGELSFSGRFLFSHSPLTSRLSNQESSERGVCCRFQGWCPIASKSLVSILLVHAFEDFGRVPLTLNRLFERVQTRSCFRFLQRLPPP